MIIFLLLASLLGAEEESPGRWVDAEITAYCPCAICCGTRTNRTANRTNTNVVPYNFAADRSLPFGTQIYVPLGYGVLDHYRHHERIFFVDDRGEKLDEEAQAHRVLRLDLRVKEHWWAVKFGRMHLIKVFIYD